MKILFLNAYFYPEVISFSHLEEELIEGLINSDNEILVICPIPTRGVSNDTAKKYRSIKFERLYNNRITVRRFWAPQEGRNPIIRAFRYIWCNYRQYQIARKLKDVDLTFAVSTPPTQGLLAGILSKKLKCPFIYSLQDVFPDSLVTTELTHMGSIIWKIGRKIETKTYSLCTKIIVISESIEQNLLHKSVDAQKLELIPNWIDVDNIKPITRNDNKLFSEFDIDPNKYIVVYAGNFGAAQGADIVIKAAELLKEISDIQFVVFGGGTEYEAAKAEVEDKKLTNILMNPLLPPDRVSEVYSLGDVALITSKPGVGKSGMPSKTWSIMACNTPIIASFDINSELADIINKTDAGVCVEPGNAKMLADAIKEKYKLSDKGYQCNSRKYVEEHTSKLKCVNKYVDLMTTVFTNNYNLE